jgi:hypothetical protein
VKLTKELLEKLIKEQFENLEEAGAIPMDKFRAAMEKGLSQRKIHAPASHVQTTQKAAPQAKLNQEIRRLGQGNPELINTAIMMSQQMAQPNAAGALAAAKAQLSQSEE